MAKIVKFDILEIIMNEVSAKSETKKVLTLLHFSLPLTL